MSTFVSYHIGVAFTFSGSFTERDLVIAPYFERSAKNEPCLCWLQENPLIIDPDIDQNERFYPKRRIVTPCFHYVGKADEGSAV